MNYRKKITSKMRKIVNKNKKHKKTKKYGGYNNNNNNNNNAVNQSTMPNENSDSAEIMDEVKKEREFNLAESPIVEKTGELAEGVAVKSIEGVGNLLGVDLSNTENTGEKLDEIKTALSNPENKEKIREIVGEAAEVGSVAIEAASPFIQPLVDKSIEVGSNALSKMGESAVKIGLNTAEEIPGVGVLIGSVRSLSNAGEAFLAASNAAAEIVTASSDSINATTKNFQEKMNKVRKEKESSINRINSSLKSFQQPFNGQRLLQPQNLTGGKTRKRRIKKI